MKTIEAIWLFLQDQILGMKWLNTLIGDGLSAMGLDINSQLGSSVQFFIYDVIKITVLLCLLIFFISIIQSYFPPERSKKILGKFHGIKANILSAAGYRYTILFMFINSLVYWLYKCRTAFRRYLFISYIFSNG